MILEEMRTSFVPPDLYPYVLAWFKLVRIYYDIRRYVYASASICPSNAIQIGQANRAM